MDEAVEVGVGPAERAHYAGAAGPRPRCRHRMSARRKQEARYRARHPEEGLRERKRRLTRQLISDAATMMFATRGFDHVRVSEVAERVGVSEKTVYNYFPTKEAMVLDTADEAVESLANALRDRRPEETITGAVMRAINEDMERFDDVPEE